MQRVAFSESGIVVSAGLMSANDVIGCATSVPTKFLLSLLSSYPPELFGEDEANLLYILIYRTTR